MIRPERPETFEPEVLALLGSIFDEAWASVAPEYALDAEAAREARAELATIMLRLTDLQLGSGELKEKALRSFRSARLAGQSQARHPLQESSCEV